MDAAVRDLVLAPFGEIVEKGKTALDNAQVADDQIMAKAAQALVREGERALKKIEPLCKKHFDEFSSNFVDALKENDEIAQYRTELNDALWEFDDYIEVDDFDADKFTELQGLSKKAAPRILDMLIRMKLEPPTRDEPVSRPPTVAGDNESTASGHATNSQDAMPRPGEPRAALLDRVVMGAQSGPDLGLEGTIMPPQSDGASGGGGGGGGTPSRSDSRRSAASSLPEEAPPEPEPNPWHVGVRPKVDTIPEGNEAEDDRERRNRVPPLWPDSPTLPYSPLGSVDESMSPGKLVDRAVREEEERWRRDAEEHRPRSVLGQQHLQQQQQQQQQQYRSPISPLATTPTAAAAKHTYNVAVPRQQGAIRPAPLQTYGTTQQQQQQQLQPAPLVTAPNGSSRYSQASSTNESTNSSLFEFFGKEFDSVSPATTANRASLLSTTAQSPGGKATAAAAPVRTNNNPYYSAHARSSPAAATASPVGQQPGLEPVHSPVEFDHGLIPVDTESSTTQVPLMPPREADCSIGLGSSFHLLKGFCDGAKEVQRGGVGVKQTKKLVYGGGSLVAAKCRQCLFELEWKSVEADLNGSPKANYKSNGVGFRLRFLSKSHLASKTVEDQLYGCLFCIQLGRTTEESDATVFFSQSQLFAHLARHPRPLPIVPGLNVFDAPEIPPAFRNDYDLHFTDPPRPNVMEGIKREVQMLPTATAVDSMKRSYGGIRRPPGGGEPLQFAVGAKIVGIEFPAKYNGDWGVGWSDQCRALFPMDCVKLDPPPKTEIRMQTTSSPMVATARWKWNPKDKDRADWLKMDKNEVITNISWAYPGHWCWSGTNSKGKWGIFPQSHMEPGSLRESGAGSDGVSIRSHERKASTGILSKLSVRHGSQRRPGSSGGSNSSHETMHAASPRPTIY